MEKIESFSFEDENIKKLKEIFPTIIGDGEKVDFDMLRNLLGDEIDSKVEKYQFTWNGKLASIRAAQKPSNGTLRPDIETSKNWDTTQNLYIEGDNLEVLKQLQKTYSGKISMIYIDPPYNTGSDFVYEDNFIDNIKNYKEQTSQNSRSNAETNGRFHTDWLNMMYPRLLLARNLLTKDGVILVNIDEHEITNLQKIVSEIFGETNDVGTIIWDKRNPKGDAKGISYQHEYIVVYARNIDSLLEKNKIMRPKKNASKILAKASQLFKNQNSTYLLRDVNKDFGIWINSQNEFSGGEKAYNKVDKDGNVYQSVSMAWPNKKKAPDDYFVPLIHPNSQKACVVPERGWRNPSKTMLELLETNQIIFGSDETTQPRRKYLLKDNMYENIPSLLYFGGSDDALLKKFGIPFETPKIVDIVADHIRSFTKEGDIILDFFSGSATTAHAVLKLNSEVGENRRFIMVQLPELTEVTSEAYKAGFINICELGKERIRRAGDEIIRELNDNKSKQGLLNDEIVDPDKIDIGFKVFKLDTSNIIPFESTKEGIHASLTLETKVNSRTELDVVFEILLKYGIFDQPINKIKIDNKNAYSVGMGYMIVCLAKSITEVTVNEISKLRPKTVIFDDVEFIDDNAKENAIYTLKRSGVEEIKSI